MSLVFAEDHDTWARFDPTSSPGFSSRGDEAASPSVSGCLSDSPASETDLKLMAIIEQVAYPIATLVR
jgi:hypothetical protein